MSNFPYSKLTLYSSSTVQSFSIGRGPWFVEPVRSCNGEVDRQEAMITRRIQGSVAEARHSQKRATSVTRSVRAAKSTNAQKPTCQSSKDLTLVPFQRPQQRFMNLRRFLGADHFEYVVENQKWGA